MSKYRLADIATPRPTILVVDDADANLVAMRRLLAKFDADIVTVRSGNEALIASLKPNIAVILLDVQMPDMDGFEVAQLLCEEEATAEIPIVFLTATYLDDLARLRGYGSGAFDYIAKPINEQILKAKVKVFLDLHRRGEQLRATIASLDESNDRLRLEVTERKRAEDLARHIALHDPLTGLANRALLEEHLISALERGKRRHYAVALVYIDIDEFKPVNDTYGHHVGDLLLIEIAHRLNQLIRREDLAARLGGDEFAVVMEGLVDVPAFALRMANHVAAGLRIPYLLEAAGTSIEVKVGASIGISICPHHAEDWESLLRAADQAIYQSKRTGRNQMHIAPFPAEMELLGRGQEK